MLDQIGQMGTAGSQTLVISTRGAPFLTDGDDWESEVHPSVASRRYGNLTWIDCRGDALRRYFIPEPSDQAVSKD